MKRRTACVCALGLVLGCFVGKASSQAFKGERIGDIWIAISPETIVLGCDKGSLVTVHTNIALSAVDRSTVELSGVPALYTKADSRGKLVGKFDQAAIEAIVTPPGTKLMLTGVTNDGLPFSGSDTVRVIIDPSPAE